MADLVGRTLGKYRIVARLGRGGMAEVYKAFQPGLRRYVAIKVMHSYMLDDPSFVGRFEREALAIGQLRHPNIVQAFDFDRDGDIYFMAMEFIDGPTLQDELQARQIAQKPFNLKEVARIFAALCSAIDYAHARGMVHRDLKPANVMLNQQGQVVLTDFGVTRMMGATAFTQTGALSGTPAYMSPEQGQGHHGDERSDIYSLGVMLYEMVTGVVPFDADTPYAIIIKHISEPLPLPTRLAPHLPVSVERIILKAMSKNPADRYQKAGELARALREAVGLMPGEEYLPLPVMAPPPRVKEIDPSSGAFPVRDRPATTAAQRGGATVAPAPPSATVSQPAPAGKTSLMPYLVGGVLILLIILGGVAAGAYLLNRNRVPTLAPPPATTITEVTSTPNLIETAEAIANATETAIALARATAAGLAGPTQTVQAATAQAEATIAQQTREAEIIAGILSAQGGTATAEALAAETAAAQAQQQAATQTAIAQATAAAEAAEAAAERAATQTAAAQVAQTAAAQATQTAQAQAAAAAATRASAVSGTFNDFEFASTWKRGDEPNGSFERSTEQTHSGRYAGKLDYNFPSAGNDYVVFAWTQALADRPNQITAWVYGDGRGHFLNVWVKDNAGETRQFTFGQIKHQGWQQMTAVLDPGQPWPAAHISGPDNGAVDYPISFQALVLDDGSDDYSGRGAIFIDDLASSTGTVPPTAVPQPTSPGAPPIFFNADRSTVNAGGCALLSWNVENVAAVYLNGEGKPGVFSQQVCPGQTTTYTLHVVLRDGSAIDKSVTITVQ